MGRGVSGGTDGLHSLIRLHRFLAGDTASWIGRGAITKGNPPHDAHPYAGRGRRGDLLTAGYTDCRGAAFIRQSAIDVEKSASHHLSLLEKSAPGILYLLSLALKIRHEHRLRARFELPRFPERRVPLLPRLFLSPHGRERVSPRLVPQY